MKRITVEMLVERNACTDEVAEFKRLFPDGVTFADLDDAVAQCRAVAGAFSWGWAAYNLLTAEALAAYDAAAAEAQAACHAAMAEARAAFYESECAAWAVLHKALVDARAAYNQAVAGEFARAFMSF